MNRITKMNLLGLSVSAAAILAASAVFAGCGQGAGGASGVSSAAPAPLTSWPAGSNTTQLGAISGSYTGTAQYTDPNNRVQVEWYTLTIGPGVAPAGDSRPYARISFRTNTVSFQVDSLVQQTWGYSGSGAAFLITSPFISVPAVSDAPVYTQITLVLDPSNRVVDTSSRIHVREDAGNWSAGYDAIQFSNDFHRL